MKKKTFISLLFALSVTMLSAQTQIEASGDTYIYAGGDVGDEGKSMIRGSEETMISYFNESRLYRRMVFLKFDLTNAPALNEIETIKLKIYGTADDGGGVNTSDGSTTPETHTVEVYNMNGTEKGGSGEVFDEQTFSYNSWVNMYDYARKPSYLAGELAGVTGEGWFEIDITDEIAEYVIGMGDESVIIGVCDAYIMKLPTEPADNSNSYITFHSKENPSGNKPSLLFNVKGGGNSISTENGTNISYTLLEGELSVTYCGQNSNLMVTDISGRIIHTASFDNNYNCSLPTQGIYILSVKDGEHTMTEKIIVR